MDHKAASGKKKEWCEEWEFKGNRAATVMPPSTKGHLIGLLNVLLRRFLTPWHVPMGIPYDSWFRTVVLPIAAMEDGTSGCCQRSVHCDCQTLTLHSSPLWRGQEQNCCHTSGTSLGYGRTMSLPSHLQKEYRCRNSSWWS